MTTISTTSVCDSAELQQRRQPRSDIVAEAESGTDRWICREGPFRQYERTLVVQTDGEDSYEATETTTYKLAVPVWAWLFHFPVRRAIENRKERYGYWWAPPDRLNRRAATVLGLLAGIQVVDGYLGTVLTQTITFAVDEFGHGNQAQGRCSGLGVVRVGVLIALATAALADKRGRRSLLIGAGITSCAFTVLGGLSPNVWVLGGSQLVARGLSTALGILIAIVAVEEMPYRSRAWAASVLTLSAGLGSGMAVWILPVADLSERGWRAIYLAAIAGIAVVAFLGRRLPESRRFVEATPQAAPTKPLRDRRRSRFVLLATSAFLLAVFLAPASGFRNDFLKDERGFSGADISLFTVTTATPIGIGLLLGGYLAERHGRRRVGALGIVLGTTLTSASFFLVRDRAVVGHAVGGRSWGTRCSGTSRLRAGTLRYSQPRAYQRGDHHGGSARERPRTGIRRRTLGSHVCCGACSRHSHHRSIDCRWVDPRPLPRNRRVGTRRDQPRRLLAEQPVPMVS